MALAVEPVRVDRSLAHLIPFFFESRRSRLLEGLRLCDAGDLPGLHRMGHDFKGACGSYGFHLLSEQGDKLYSVRDVDEARQLIIGMLGYLARVRVDYV